MSNDSLAQQNDSWLILSYTLSNKVLHRSDYPRILDYLKLVLQSEPAKVCALRQSIFSDTEIPTEALTLLALVMNNQEDLKSRQLDTSIVARRRSAWLKDVLNLGDVYTSKLVKATLTSQQLTESSQHISPEISDGEFILLAFEQVLQRGCLPAEVSYWRDYLQRASRPDLVVSLFLRSLEDRKKSQAGSASAVDPHSLRVLGSDRMMSRTDWERRRAELTLGQAAEAEGGAKPHNAVGRLRTARTYGVRARPQVSIITSLYRGSKYITQFMQMITQLDDFDERAELIIIDADSPEGEGEIVERYTRQFPNIVYQRQSTRVGIYEAWNIAIAMSRGEYITNANVDDLRRRDSISLQADVLDRLLFVDVVYQDFYYTFEHDMSFENIAKMNFRSELPIVSPHNMLDFNSPHNAPMWKKSLHTELGGFDSSFKSAGDFEFWLRCLGHNKIFYKINEPHVAYFQNPEGISTSPDSPGLFESRRILKRYSRLLIGRELVVDDDQFVALLGEDRAGVEHRGDRYRMAQQALAKLGKERTIARV